MTPYANDDNPHAPSQFSEATRQGDYAGAIPAEHFPLPPALAPCGYCGRPVEGTHAQMDGKSYHLHCVGRIDHGGESVVFEDLDPRPFLGTPSPTCRNCGKLIDPLCAACGAAMGS